MGGLSLDLQGHHLNEVYGQGAFVRGSLFRAYHIRLEPRATV